MIIMIICTYIYILHYINIYIYIYMQWVYYIPHLWTNMQW